MAKMYRSELIGLFGNPVDENPTVVTIEAGFKALDMDWRYTTMQVLPEDLETAVKALKALHFKGTHITIPHKVEVLKYLDEISPAAQLIGAVNTVYLRDGALVGENTDGKGFMKSLLDSGTSPAGKNIVILGAGGAARAVAIELAQQNAGHITIVNGNTERGNAVCELLNKKTGTKADYCPWDETYTIPEDTDIVVNCTSVGLYPDAGCPNIDYDSLRSGMLVCDVVPNPPETLFIRKAKERGCKAINGLPMLVNQAGISFTLWTGREAPIEQMLQATLDEFAQD